MTCVNRDPCPKEDQHVTNHPRIPSGHVKHSVAWRRPSKKSLWLGIRLGRMDLDFSAVKKCLWNFSRSKNYMLYNLKSKHVDTFSASLTSSHVIWSILAKISFLTKFGILSVHNGFSMSWTSFQGYWYMYRSSRKTKPKSRMKGHSRVHPWVSDHRQPRL